MLFGIGLIGMTGLLEAVRHSHEADPVLLVAGNNSDQPNTTALYLMGAGSTVHQRIAPPAYSYRETQCSPNSNWLYIVASSTREQSYSYSGTLLRISRDGQLLEEVTDRVMSLDFICTPDDKWLLKTSTDEVGNVDIIRMQAQDAENPYNLTATFEPSVAFDSFPNEKSFSDTGQWVYFRVWQQGGGFEVFRVSIDGSIPENLTTEIEVPAHLIAVTDDWLLFLAGEMIYVTDSDGRNTHPLFPDSVPVDSVFALWLAPLNLVIAETRSQDGHWLWAFEMPENTLRWRYEGLTIQAVSQSNDSFVVQDEANSILYMGADGRQVPKVILKNGEYRYVRSISNGTLFFLQNASVDSALWQMNLQDGTTQKIFEPITREGEISEWSQDGKWVAILDYDLNTNSNAYHYTIANSVGRPTYRLNNQLKYATLFRWLPPIDRAWSPVGLLVMGSVLMLGGVMRRGGKSTL